MLQALPHLLSLLPDHPRSLLHGQSNVRLSVLIKNAAEEVSECCNYVFVQETDIKKVVWEHACLHQLFCTLAGDDIKKMTEDHPYTFRLSS